MHTYLYDGTFDGLFTAFFYAYKDPDVYDICRQYQYQPDLLSQPLTIHTERDKVKRIDQAIRHKLSNDTLDNLYYLYLSEVPHCDWLGLRYLRLCFKEGAGINRAKHHPIIRQIDDYRQKVFLELDHMKGFLRFEQIDEMVFFARFAPDHNQLPLLQPHLQKRFSDQKMIVHDEKRNCALIYNLHHSMIIPFTTEDASQLLSGKRDDHINLFRQYVQSVNIPERVNPKLQAAYMPHRYRAYMPETQNQDENNPK